MRASWCGSSVPQGRRSNFSAAVAETDIASWIEPFGSSASLVRLRGHSFTGGSAPALVAGPAIARTSNEPVV
jgi:hypothetical protein